MTFRTLVAAAAVALLAGVARAQDAVPCKALTCVLTLDWGGSKTAADYPPDKRYGSGDDFEQMIKAANASDVPYFQPAFLPPDIRMSENV